jgi:hypothetical protein
MDDHGFEEDLKRRSAGVAAESRELFKWYMRLRWKTRDAIPEEELEECETLLKRRGYYVRGVLMDVIVSYADAAQPRIPPPSELRTELGALREAFEQAARIMREAVAKTRAEDVEMLQVLSSENYETVADDAASASEAELVEAATSSPNVFDLWTAVQARSLKCTVDADILSSPSELCDAVTAAIDLAVARLPESGRPADLPYHSLLTSLRLAFEAFTKTKPKLWRSRDGATYGGEFFRFAWIVTRRASIFAGKHPQSDTGLFEMLRPLVRDHARTG